MCWRRFVLDEEHCKHEQRRNRCGQYEVENDVTEVRSSANPHTLLCKGRLYWWRSWFVLHFQKRRCNTEQLVPLFRNAFGHHSSSRFALCFEPNRRRSVQVGESEEIRTRRTMMIPERIGATDALRIGLVDRIVEDEAAMEAYEKEWRKCVKAAAPQAVGLVSDLIDAMSENQSLE